MEFILASFVENKGDFLMTATHTQGTTPDPLVTPNAQRLYTVTRKDLPICCPMPDARLWDSHPRVFLSVEKSGQARCPYCGAEYLLRPE